MKNRQGKRVVPFIVIMVMVVLLGGVYFYNSYISKTRYEERDKRELEQLILYLEDSIESYSNVRKCSIEVTEKESDCVVDLLILVNSEEELLTEQQKQTIENIVSDCLSVMYVGIDIIYVERIYIEE